jgi:hypothetical protein
MSNGLFGIIYGAMSKFFAALNRPVATDSFWPAAAIRDRDSNDRYGRRSGVPRAHDADRLTLERVIWIY